jgi:glucuronoarabinoxylan endo-1,4-beta-xylanase
LPEITSINRKEQKGTLPYKFSLEQNYPNPFNPLTIIPYQIAMSSKVKISVYDILGREVAILVNERQSAGRYRIEFEANNLASGIYVYKLSTDSFEQSRKMLLLR